MVNIERSDVQIKGVSDVFRVSVSSAPSTSSHGSAQDESEVFGDVYVWGEVVSDYSRIGTEKTSSFSSTRNDILQPKPLESHVVLDVQHVACGVRHAVLVTRQGEVFTWGEESGGRLGHGVAIDAIHPRLVESLSVSNIDFVACGEFHSCALTASGELYTWGDGAHQSGLLGHGTDISHWIPKRVSGPLEGLQVASVSCGTWHTALISTTGQLFTFGDGTFGVLGHGNRESVSYPREVESLMGLKTVAVSCGVWHMAAVVEVIVTQSSASSGKLFTWGDGDKYRLGHGDKEPRLKPTCVPSLIDYNFHKLACGHSLTIGLTTSGHIFTMGSTVYGQLGNPHSDGKLPCLVEDKLANESVKSVACGAYHVAVLTSRSEIYTWGKGANGRLGHGDLEDRKAPTLVEALKDRPVKHIACGANFTAAICLHKWVSGAEQSQCTACRQTFGFTRKRHNCYNCGLVHCHSCSARKALRAALAPNPRKPYRVCDSCYMKLNKAIESGGMDKKIALPRLSGESKDRFDKADTKISKAASPSNLDLIKNIDTNAAKCGKKSESLPLIRTSQFPSLLQLRDIALPVGPDMLQANPRIANISAVQSNNHFRAVSPFSRKHSPPRSATPIPTMYGLSFSKSIADSLKKTNELLNQEVQMLRAQVNSLNQRCELQEIEIQKSAKKIREAMVLATEESAKSKAAKEVIKSLTAQLKDMAERLPQGVYEEDPIKVRPLPNGIDSLAFDHMDSIGAHNLKNRDDGSQQPQTAAQTPSIITNRISERNRAHTDDIGANGTNTDIQNRGVSNPIGMEKMMNTKNSSNAEPEPRMSSSRSDYFDTNNANSVQTMENGSKPRSPTSTFNQVEAEWIEQYEPGVYITLTALRDGTRDLKRVRFSRRRFGEQQAEEWWSENREKVYEKYNVRGSDKPSSTPT
ncbi:PH, RCC1 and FYVE domains-containing protein 1 [Dendrobium catenatum]|uniref:Ultraviolet-B receptor UVR8 n=1 Tax=Dendrobium catenatum TaxID=906689 RepID=A0A2I0WNU6_9ASPA|nr:PH, RCC1 and FYVE domains-containing protein 1 [Dendrobium catenatum]XP_020688465.1 PH, RCC1 and FYVE domains-containing protein 1 [Dendrobium catenatum]XP_020688466.1 PH, RCC1 and FYVE domains-containing protein 1 [Dendrobium catenatum]PKU77324.1 Ultraviolet-B receptor UVR8 [Dendrobium catenatum]